MKMATGSQGSVFLQVTGSVSNGHADGKTTALGIDDGGVSESETKQVSCEWDFRKVLKTCFIYVGYLCLGAQHVMLGATLLEVQIQTGLEVDQLSFLVTWLSIGSMLGTLLGGATFDRYNIEFQLGVGLTVASAVAICFPLVSNYYLISIIIFVQGLSLGFVTIGTYSCVFSSWASNPAPFFQALMCTFSVGCVLAPVLAKPFLTTESAITDHENMTLLPANSTSSSEADGSTKTTSVWLQSEPTESRFFHPGSFYPYLIIAIAEISPSIYFYMDFAMNKCHIRRQKPSETRKSKKIISRQRLPIFLLFVLLLFFPCGIEMIFASLLNTYVVKHLQWSVGTANTLLTTFWIVYVVTRAIGILVSNYVSARTILAFCFPVMTSSLVVMAFLEHEPVAVWTSVVAVSTAVSLLFSNCMLYAETFFKISAAVSSLLVSTCYAGMMCMPVLAGYLFDNVNKQCYIYITLGISVTMGIDFVVIWVVGRRYKTVKKDGDILSMGEDDDRSHKE